MHFVWHLQDLQTFKPSCLLASLFSAVWRSLSASAFSLSCWILSLLPENPLMFLSKEWAGSSPSWYLQCLSGFLSQYRA